MVLNNLYQVRAYNIKHNYNIKEFLEDYKFLLQRAIDEIWKNIKWIERSKQNRKRTIPIILSDGKFKNHYLRYLLLSDWKYSKHYVDSAIKQAYSILHTWKRNYLKGKAAREKPIVKKKFVRIKETLYSYKNGVIKVSIKPNKEYLKFDISKAWFWNKVKNYESLGELILNENYLTITFRFKQNKNQEAKTKGKIAWDSNEKSLDGFNPKIGWIKVDLTKLFHIHRVYEIKRARLQSLTSKKPKLKELLQKYSKREKNRAKDFIHKLTTQISKVFEGYVHGFEDLKKDDMLNYSKTHNRNIAKSDWRMIFKFLSYKAKTITLNPYHTTKRCSRCGMINAPKGASYNCRGCGLSIDRQLNGAINLYLQMEGFSPSPKLFDELMKAWSGFTLTGEKADDKASMNPEKPEADESQELCVYKRLHNSEPFNF